MSMRLYVKQQIDQIRRFKGWSRESSPPETVQHAVSEVHRPTCCIDYKTRLYVVRGASGKKPFWHQPPLTRLHVPGIVQGGIRDPTGKEMRCLNRRVHREGWYRFAYFICRPKLVVLGQSRSPPTRTTYVVECPSQL